MWKFVFSLINKYLGNSFNFASWPTKPGYLLSGLLHKKLASLCPRIFKTFALQTTAVVTTLQGQEENLIVLSGWEFSVYGMIYLFSMPYISNIKVEIWNMLSHKSTGISFFEISVLLPMVPSPLNSKCALVDLST